MRIETVEEYLARGGEIKSWGDADPDCDFETVTRAQLERLNVTVPDKSEKVADMRFYC